MKCPHCGTGFPLTWKWYLTGQGRKPLCPSCNQKSKLAWSKNYARWLVLVTVIAAGLEILFLWLTHDKVFGTVCAIGASLIILLPLDRRCDDKLRLLRPIKSSVPPN
jgi:uncharacterized protein (DUF983 family)